MATKRIDIFGIIDKLQQKNRAVIDQEEQAAPFLLQRWLSGTNDELQILLLNDTSNEYLFSLNKQPKLAMSLLVAATSGNSNRCRWIKQTANKEHALVNSVVAKYYGITIKEAKLHAAMMSKDDILDAACFVGLQPDEIKNLKKQLS
jgi:hypothetical protein